MKKILCSFLCVVTMLLALFGGNTENYYADAGVSLSLSASTVKIGDEVSVTVSIPNDYSASIDVVFPKDLLTFQGASVSTNNIGTTQLSNGRINLNLSDIMNLTSVTLKFRAEAEGSGNVTAEVMKAGNNTTEESVQWSNVSKAIKVEKTAVPAPDVPAKSDDNSLVSLKLSSGTLSPAFKGNVTKYTATVGYDVTEITVSATKSSSKAEIVSVTGDGKPIKLNVGENTIKIAVKAENGVTATYTVVVTRKAKDTTTPQPTESEQPSESETTPPEVNEILQWHGEQLQVADQIPAESIPADFESKLLVVNGQQMQGLSFNKGDLKVLYLNNTNGAGSLYVYDEALETIYPFIKLASEKSYVMVLLPDEQNAPAPEGFESCTFSIEGKGIISAYQWKEDSPSAWNFFGAETFYAAPAKANEFYLIYCMNDDGEKGWYMYDSVEETFQRYYAAASSVQVGGTPSDDVESGDDYAKLEKELNAAKTTQYIIIAIAAAIIIILIIIIIVLAIKKRPEDDGYWDDVYDEDETASVEETVDEAEDDEIEIEFYNMEEAIVDETEKSEKVISKDDESDLEFIDFE